MNPIATNPLWPSASTPNRIRTAAGGDRRLAADRYGSLDYVGEEATSEVSEAIAQLLGQLQSVTWPADANEEALAQVLWLLETLVADISG